MKERVSEWRKRRGYTQAELAKAIGKPQSYIGRIENGNIKAENLTFANLHVLAKILHVSIEELVDCHE